MPLYEYAAEDPQHACEHCQRGFEMLRSITAPPLTKCPRCGAAIIKLISPPAVGASLSGYDDRAKTAGFHKLKKTGKGEYEKMY